MTITNITYFRTGITFVASVTFTNERFTKEILNRKSATFKELEAKIKYNVSFSLVVDGYFSP